MEFISSTEKSLLLIPYIVIFLGILSIICMKQIKNKQKS